MRDLGRPARPLARRRETGARGLYEAGCLAEPRPVVGFLDMDEVIVGEHFGHPADPIIRKATSAADVIDHD
jgi:hypothetical protein